MTSSFTLSKAFRGRFLRCSALLTSALLCTTLSGVEPPLVTAMAVRSLSQEAASQKLPVEVRGTVVFIEGPNGAIVLQDETAGTYFRGQNETTLRIGDYVLVKGVTTPGVYLPGIEAVSYEKVGRQELPSAVPATYADFVSGRYFFQRVAVEGTVHAVKATADKSRSILSLAMGQELLEVRVCEPPQEGRFLVDSRVRIEGLASGGINQRRQLVQPIAWVHDWGGLQVLEAAPPESEVPLISGSKLFTFDLAGRSDHRVRVVGTVIASFSQGEVFIRDEKTPLRLQFHPPVSLNVGARIEVVGFPKMHLFSASLVSASLVQQSAGATPFALEASFDDLLKGGHDNDLVVVTAVLSSSFRTEGGDVLVLDQNGSMIRAQVPSLPKVPLSGTRLQITGICHVESNTASGTRLQPDMVSLRCRSIEDVAVLHAPSWWTAPRLVFAVGMLLLAVVVSGLWIAILRRQVRQQTWALRRQIEHKATLEERQRIAREFHDTLEQGLTGLALRLEGVQARGIDEKNAHLLRSSCRLISQIQAETRSLLAVLREPDPDSFDIAAALLAIGEEHPAGCEPALKVEIGTGRTPLPSRTVHHLRMIAREAVTNALKHAQARHICVALVVEGGCLRMTVSDDGRGFDPATPRCRKAGHFGCIGIEERCEKLGSTAYWRSVPGQGTTVEIELPLESISSLAHS